MSTITIVNSGRAARLRSEIQTIRDVVRSRFEGGANGLQLAALHSERVDRFISETMTELVETLPPADRRRVGSRCAIVAVGGTGRSELCPCSDVDLLLLHEPAEAKLFQDVASQFVRDCWDAGLKLGHSVHTRRDALRKARSDIQFATSLVDARPLWGAATLTASLLQSFRRQIVGRRIRAFIRDCRAARQAEQEQFGATTQQLEPDLKRSLGGLRDVHLIRWIGFARYGVSDLESLKLHGALSADEVYRLIQAYDHLLLLRINLHLHSGKLHDLLTREDQLRVATERGIVSLPGQLPVERLMTSYFLQSSTIAEISERFAMRNTPSSWPVRLINTVLSYRVNNIFRVGISELQVPVRFRAQGLATLEGVLQAYLTAARFRVQVAPDLNDAIKARAVHLAAALSAEAANLFMQILGSPGMLGSTLRSMYRAGILELILPCFRHVRSLLQFNQYHSYTVDEHTLQAVEAAERLALDPGLVGRVYRETHEKSLLFLAILLHDAGKGYPEDHSEVGRELAHAVAMRLGLSRPQRELVMFLVHKHLLMTHLAFRRNTSDPQILLNFTHEVGSAETLRLLYVLTVADITAVGPTAWNDWKGDLLADLYQQTLQWLTGETDQTDLVGRSSRVIDEVLLVIQGPRQGNRARQIPAEQAQIFLQQLTSSYLLTTPVPQIAADVLQVLGSARQDVCVTAAYDAETQTVEYRVIAHENTSSGCFHKITGVLSSRGMEILSAQICTSSDGVIIDSFRVRDNDHAGIVPSFRLNEVIVLIERVLRDEFDVGTLFRSRRRYGQETVLKQISNLAPRVTIDNRSSETCSVIDIFAQDRHGLLYDITRALYELRLSVEIAKISTHFDQTVDVFYVTESEGGKLVSEIRLSEVQQRLDQIVLPQAAL